MKKIEKVYTNIGQKIRTVRKSKKMTLEDLAFKIDMDWSFLARIETGKAVASLETLYKIADALNIKFVQLFENIDVTKYEIINNEFVDLLKGLSVSEQQRVLRILKLILKKD